MSKLDRRSFIAGSAAAAAGLAAAGPFSGFVAQAGGVSGRIPGYGPLRATPDERDGNVRLDLPEGFHYRSFHVAGEVLPDGTIVPGKHDGMFAFPGRDGGSILIRNHEVNGNTAADGLNAEIGLPSAGGYDPLGKGGTMTVVVDRFGNVSDSHVSLGGTQMNCAGGNTPWGTYLSCEETVNGDGVGADFTGTLNTGLRQHGYIFEVPTSGMSSAEPITRAGRFAHEQAAVHPNGKEVYLTEDNFNFPSGFYRFLPDRNPHRDGRLTNAGRLQMLALKGQPGADLSGHQPAGTSYAVTWVDIEDPDPDMTDLTNDEAIRLVGDEGRSKGAATFSRLEGAVFHAGRCYFTSTQGGAQVGSAPFGFGNGRGQVWAYHAGRERLELVYESPSADVLDLPDNVAASKTGSLVLCEDGSGDNFLRGLTPQGHVFDFARNADPLQIGQEFAGATFNQNHSTLFVNLQSGPTTERLGGYSLAIWGPWSKGPF
jgi:hypothetical protein